MFQEDDYVYANVIKPKRNVIGRDVKSRRTSNDVVTPSPKRNSVNQLYVVGEGKRKLMTSAAKGEGHCFNVLRCDLGGEVGGCHSDSCC